MSTKLTKRQNFESSYGYTDMMKKHSLSETGLWEIYGEDPNCDFGGCHSNPRLGTAEGKLDDVIDYAVELPSFFQWGSGGKIVKVAGVIKVNPVANAVRTRLTTEKVELEARLEAIKRQLKE